MFVTGMMTHWRRRLAAVLAVFVFAGDGAYPQVSLLVRGTITAFDGNVLSVKTLEGTDLRLRLSGDTSIVVTDSPADRSALKPGAYIFTSAAVAADGTMTVERIQLGGDEVKPPR
jgi:hypothetical protein